MYPGAQYKYKYGTSSTVQIVSSHSFSSIPYLPSAVRMCVKSHGENTPLERVLIRTSPSRSIFRPDMNRQCGQLIFFLPPQKVRDTAAYGAGAIRSTHRILSSDEGTTSST